MQHLIRHAKLSAVAFSRLQGLLGVQNMQGANYDKND